MASATLVQRVERIGGKADPPMVVVWYAKAGSGSPALARHGIRLKPAAASHGPAAVHSALTRRYRKFFGTPQASAALGRVLARILGAPATSPGATASVGSALGSPAGRSGDLPSAATAPTAAKSVPAGRTGPPRAGAGAGAGGDRDSLLLESAGFGDLQTAHDSKVRAAKSTMNKGFEANRLRPGDDGYEYDKRVEFGEPEDDNEWDDDLDDLLDE